MIDAKESLPLDDWLEESKSKRPSWNRDDHILQLDCRVITLILALRESRTETEINKALHVAEMRRGSKLEEEISHLRKDKELALAALPDGETIAELDEFQKFKAQFKTSMIYAYEDTSDRYYLNVLDKMMPGWEK